MSNYRRMFVPGGTYFFTVVTANRSPWLGDDRARRILAESMRAVRDRRPFTTNAIVVLPDHLHCIWTLPPGDSEFALRWKAIKQRCALGLRREGLVKGPAWQKHYWEHLIRDEADFCRHFDYIHYNPVKHGLCEAPAEWRARSFHRCVDQGIYPLDWGGPVEEFEVPE